MSHFGGTAVAALEAQGYTRHIFMNLTAIVPLPEFATLLCFTLQDPKEILHGPPSPDT